MKKKTTNLLLLLVVIGTIAAVWVYFFVYNKKHPDYENLKPDYTMEAKSLFEAYRNDITSASALYNGKMILITGTLTAIDESGGLAVAVLSIEQGLFGDEGLRINMLPAHAEKLRKITPGQQVMIKGYVTGYNDIDVVLEYGSLIMQ
ncbi:MAG TPA: hypothetical protein PKE03_09840 [Bacteroidales bacterium]|nr:hypothetical protein [Bacteroidales bacterium]